MTDREPHALVTALHEHLEATQERPVERMASRWIGEAEAVAGDIAGADVTEDVIHERVGHVEELLAHVESTEDELADEHLGTAKELTRQILEVTGAE